jgi:hypothetical protein
MERSHEGIGAAVSGAYGEFQMKIIEKVARGLLIIAKYEGAAIAAEHNEIWIGPYEPRKILPSDRHELESLGWRFNRKHDTWEYSV